MKSSNPQGLTEQQALELLEKHGPNELPADKKKGFLKIFQQALKEPMVILLLIIGTTYLFIGNIHEFTSLMLFLGLILGITTYQEFKTEKTLQALKSLSSPRALVVRDGIKKRIPGKEVVPGDLIILEEGDRVAADAIIKGSGQISIDESLLTGESAPVNKNNGEPVFGATLVTSGRAYGVCAKTGAQTELGKIGSISKQEAPPPSPLQKETRRLVKKVAIYASALSIFVALFYSLTQESWAQGLIAGLTLAMAILPNELPAVLLVFMAGGAWRISKKKVLTRRAPAVEALGSATTLCVDKTGTLTTNQMRIKALWSKEGVDTFYPKDPSSPLPERYHSLLEYGILACRRHPFDPMEKAFINAGKDFLADTEHLHPNWSLEKEYSFTKDLMAVSYAWKAHKENFIIAAKGAPEAIIDLCHMPVSESAKVMAKVEHLAQRGLRVLAVAQGLAAKLPPIQHDIDFEFLGLVGFEDPLRADVKAAIAECYQAGIRVVMITGDHPATAKSIAKQIGLKNYKDFISGADFKESNPQDFSQKVQDMDIFCRMKPEQKLELVKTLQSAGEVVAMTGDGVNDVPALKAADIGIAMGKRGSDVAREAANIVLLEDNFSAIVSAIKVGRTSYFNLKKAYNYLFAVHIPITVISILPVVFELPLVLLPAHIAFLHLVIEPASTLAFESAPPPNDIMKEPPRSPNAALFDQAFIKSSIQQGSIVSLFIILVFLISLGMEKTPEDVRTLTFNALIIANLGLIWINIKLGTNHLEKKKLGISEKKALNWITIGSIILLGAVLYFPELRSLFGFERQHYRDVALSLGIGIAPILVIILLKRLKIIQKK